MSWRNVRNKIALAGMAVATAIVMVLTWPLAWLVMVCFDRKYPKQPKR